MAVLSACADVLYHTLHCFFILFGCVACLFSALCCDGISETLLIPKNVTEAKTNWYVLSVGLKESVIARKAPKATSNVVIEHIVSDGGSIYAPTNFSIYCKVLHKSRGLCALFRLFGQASIQDRLIFKTGLYARQAYMQDRLICKTGLYARQAYMQDRLICSSCAT